MIFDALLSVSEDLTSLGTTAKTIGDPIDLGVDANQGLIATVYGPGWVVHMDGVTSGSTPDLIVSIITSDNEGMSNPTTLFTSVGVPFSAVSGGDFNMFIPVPQTDAWKRYFAFQIRTSASTLTGGEVTVQYAADARMWRAYPAETGR